MGSHFEFLVCVDTERVQGKFASRDDLSSAIEEALNEAESSIEVDGLGDDGDSEYEITSYDVEELESKGTKSRRPAGGGANVTQRARDAGTLLNGFVSRGVIKSWRAETDKTWMLETPNSWTVLKSLEAVEAWLQGVTLMELRANPIQF